MNGIPLLPQSASTFAPRTDALYFTLVAVSGAIALLSLPSSSFLLPATGAARLRARGALPPLIQHEFEIGWTTATLFAFLMLFWWAGSNQIYQLLPPSKAMEIHVVAKQWMWKIQHSNGVREINMLHAPVDEPIRLDMTSQDVIHSFAVPDFRIKQDILPGRYVESWFRATKTGTFRLYCTQFCGTAHSGMVGSVVMMSKADFAAWLAGAAARRRSRRAGPRAVREPRLRGLSHRLAGLCTPPISRASIGRNVPLSNGGFALVDDAYIRDRILDPQSNPPAGYDPIMPSFKGEVTDGEILALTAYIRSLEPNPGALR